jgi:hypothetical protein
MIKDRLEEMDTDPESKKGHKAAKGHHKKKKDKKGGHPISPKDMTVHLAKITKMFMYIADFRRKAFIYRMEYAWHRRQPIEDKDPSYENTVRLLKKNADSVHGKLIELLNLCGIKKETTKDLEKEATVAFCEELMEKTIETGMFYKQVIADFGWRRVFTPK